MPTLETIMPERAGYISGMLSSDNTPVFGSRILITALDDGGTSRVVTPTKPYGVFSYSSPAGRYLVTYLPNNGYTFGQGVAWQYALTNYSLVLPSTPNGFRYRVEMPGTDETLPLSGTEPVWPTTVGATVVYRGKTLTCELLEEPQTVGPIFVH